MPFDYFIKYPNRILIESGSHVGDGIQKALDAGFEEVYSIELTPKYYEHCKRRFSGDNRVHLVFGDTILELPKVLDKISECATIYLDGHWDITEQEIRGIEDFPLNYELLTIANHQIKTHKIIIDDVRLFSTLWDIKLETVLELIYKINKNYTITFEDGYQANDVLVAEVL